tara:strand:- start:666 stop:1976 length:1311 start_codon:yes stop_codon:yes gene_type:complete
MAVGKSPYSDDTNAFRIQEKIMREPFPVPSHVYPGVSKKLEIIIFKSTQKDKNDRYKSCEEFKRNLELPLEKISKIKTTEHIQKTKRNNFIFFSSILFLCFIFFYNSLDTKNEEKIEGVVVEELDNLDSRKIVKFKIGDFFGGGIIFHIFKNGENALVCDIKDLGKVKFGDVIDKEKQVKNAESIGTGRQNTMNLHKRFKNPEAANLCVKSKAQGYDDWYLPSIDELNEMYLNKSIIDSTSLSNGGSVFVKNCYWSSTSDPYTWWSSWKQDFGSVGDWNQGKRAGNYDNLYNVRAVRTVSLKSTLEEKVYEQDEVPNIRKTITSTDPIEEIQPKKQKNHTIINKNKIVGCWQFYYSWSCGDLRQGTPYCYNIDGTFGGNTEDNIGTWNLKNNSFSQTIFSNGTNFNGIYRNGIIEGKIIAIESGQTGCFKMIKKNL